MRSASAIAPLPRTGARPPPPIEVRSLDSVVIATRQPSPTSPMRSASGTRTPVRYTSLNSACPVICRSGRTSTPGEWRSSPKYVIPRCLGWSGSVRAISIARLHRWALVVHTFWPSTTHSSPSRTARQPSPAMSEPAPGSLNSWHHESSPVNARRSKRAHSSSEPCTAIVGPARATPPPAASVPTAMPWSWTLRTTSSWRPGAAPSPPRPTRVVHPGEPEVVQPAALLDRIVGRRGQHLGDRRVDRVGGITHRRPRATTSGRRSSPRRSTRGRWRP